MLRRAAGGTIATVTARSPGAVTSLPRFAALHPRLPALLHGAAGVIGAPAAQLIIHDMAAGFAQHLTWCTPLC